MAKRRKLNKAGDRRGIRKLKTSRPDGGKVYRSFANFREGDRVRLQFAPYDDNTNTLRRGVTGTVESVEPGAAVNVRWNVANDARDQWSIFQEDLSNGILSRR